ncbi:hypothetical protein SSX86_020206 [Deinandra increscens subsp. villosa]|uniref:Uncharacterized protein n=1 Tax=Deinandra increscens subsp. villosa TaxID=3103831 RepID=A0AAP0GQM9_9ASTR
MIGVIGPNLRKAKLYKLHQSPKTLLLNSSAQILLQNQITRISQTIRRCFLHESFTFDSISFRLSISTAAMENSVERSFQDQCGGKDDTTKIKKISTVASSKLGAARCTNRDKLVGIGDRLNKSQQHSKTQVSKLHQVPLVERKFQKSAVAGPGQKVPSVYSLRSKNQITEGAPSYNLRSKVQKSAVAGPGQKVASVYSLRSKNQITEGAPSYNLRSKVQKTAIAAGPGQKASSVYNVRSENQITKGAPSCNLRSKVQKTAFAGPGQKVPSVYNIRSENKITKGAPSYIPRSKVQKTQDQNPYINIQNKKILKKDGSKDSSVAIQKREISQTSAKPIKKIQTTKSLTASRAGLDKKSHPLTSQHEFFSREPIYHIRWKGEDAENGPLGQNCLLCNKDLSCAAEDDDSEYNDDFHYEDDDEYYDDLNPPLLPAVDILSCGHAYHTECFQNGTAEEQSSDPHCILCCN